MARFLISSLLVLGCGCGEGLVPDHVTALGVNIWWDETPHLFTDAEIDTTYADLSETLGWGAKYDLHPDGAWVQFWDDEEMVCGDVESAAGCYWDIVYVAGGQSSCIYNTALGHELVHWALDRIYHDSDAGHTHPWFKLEQESRQRVRERVGCSKGVTNE